MLGPRPGLQGPAAVTGTLRDFTRDLSTSNRLVVDLDEKPPAKARIEGEYAYVVVAEPTHARISYPSRTGSEPGDFGGLSQQITVDEQATSHQLSVRINDDFTAATAGYHFIQVLIDDDVVVEEDVAGGGSWRDLTADVTDQLAGKATAKLTLRLFEKRGVGNFAVTVMFDDVAITGTTIVDGSFEDPSSTAWVPESNSPSFRIRAHATDGGNGRNAVYPIRSVKITDGTRAVLDIGDLTTISGYVDPEDFDQGFRYDVAEGAAVSIPLTRSWQA